MIRGFFVRSVLQLMVVALALLIWQERIVAVFWGSLLLLAAANWFSLNFVRLDNPGWRGAVTQVAIALGATIAWAVIVVAVVVHLAESLGYRP